MRNLKSIKTEAQSLRKALRATPVTAPSHAQTLDLVAKMKGSKDWNTFYVDFSNHYFERLHAPYLPGSALHVRALSIRYALGLELFPEVVDDDCAMRDLQLGLATMQWQFQQIEFNALIVDPRLKRAVDEVYGMSVEAGRLFETHHGEIVEKMLTEGGYTTLPTDGSYTQQYLKWRFATFVANCSGWHNADPSVTLMGLIKARVNLFDYVAEAICAKVPEKLGSEAAARLPMRMIWKVLLLAAIRGDSPQSIPEELMNLDIEASACTPRALRNYRKIIDEMFPELAAWHAWLDVKALLAPDMEAFTKDNFKAADWLLTH